MNATHIDLEDKLAEANLKLARLALEEMKINLSIASEQIWRRRLFVCFAMVGFLSIGVTSLITLNNMESQAKQACEAIREECRLDTLKISALNQHDNFAAYDNFCRQHPQLLNGKYVELERK